ncbi:NADH-quinone oxidoreductase subunit A [Balnearium lithotrophicum]|uniref:NADH-quinone oxidoreductase subunit A n=1 Tax=Balnearium lithotrophicum TaxID=223788 RepID=A0A521AGI5_9BACT|nr:NADH-quinone oxidoreductase subunit A [Balnearium lithotrophicum]SMO33921.1 NADH-quinone oxidoreductase subunit A [Balnearium lithotrophicum]
METYLVLFVFFIVALSIALLVPNVSLITNRFLKIDKNNPDKFEPYECGIPRIKPLTGHYFAFFYILALVFLLFDLETIFLFPWAVSFRELGVFGVVEAFVFVGILLVGFFYAIAKGALRWD